MRVLVVRLSSLGDVIHAAPVLHDLHRAHPGAAVDWVVEEAFVPLVRCFVGVDRIVPFALRRWRRTPLPSRGEALAFLRSLRERRYDRVLDLQGLLKSALVTRAARLAAGGQRVGLANRTDGSAYEPIARLAYGRAIVMPARIPVVERSRRLAAEALGTSVSGVPRIDWRLPPLHDADAPWADADAVWLVHGSAKPVKRLDDVFWVALARGLALQGRRVLLPWGSDAERARSESIAAAAGAGTAVPPRLPLDRLAGVMAASAGSIGLDTGLTHLSATLARPTVQLFIEDKSWRAAIDWQPRTAVVQATDAAPITPEAALRAWARVAAS